MRFLDTSNIRTRFNERVLTNDGIALSVDLYLPPEPGHYPVLLNRTPADNNRNGRAGISEPPAERWKKFAAQGYIVVAGDVRGRGDSEGKFKPFINEACDGATTIAWLRTLDEGNGQIGLFGSGYSAFCAWAAACTSKDNIDAIVSSSPFGAVGEGLVHCHGAVRLDWLFWMHLIAGRTVQPANTPLWSSIYQHLPLNTMDQALGRNDIWWQEWLEHLDPSDPYWDSLDLAGKIASLTVPGLHISGWWDGQLASTQYYYQAACQSTAPQHLVIGPWDSAGVRRPSPDTGGFNFGPRSAINMDEEMVNFFNVYLMKDTFALPAPVRLFVTGRNEWVEHKGWPTANINSKRVFYLRSTMGANTCCGDGQLTAEGVDADVADKVTHNPAIPITFQPEFISFASGANLRNFTLEQAFISSRDEALVYTSKSLQGTMSVIGKAQVSLMVKVNAEDADLFVLLSDSFPGGTRDLHLAHSALRLSTQKEFRAGEFIKITLDLNDIVHDFLPGHQVRLTITPSLFPLYARNLHTVNYLATSKLKVADIEFSLRDCSLTLMTVDSSE